MIERIRLQYNSNIADDQIAWAIQLHNSRLQLEWCAPLIRRCYPASRVVLITDGDEQYYEDLADKYGFELVLGLHWMTLQTCHLYVNRLLEHLLDGPEEYLFRIDPDTKLWRRVNALPAFSSLFGTLETISEYLRDEILVPANVQGGCIGMTRDAADELLSSGVLNHQSCVTDYKSTWARCADALAMAQKGTFADDFVLSWAAFRLGIPVVECEEIRSRWRRDTFNDDLRYAITHPHKLDKVRTMWPQNRTV